MSSSTRQQAPELQQADSGLTIAVRVFGQSLDVAIPPEALDQLRHALGMTLAEPSRPSPFMTAEEAADLLRCRKRRIYELVGDGRLERCGDGRRLLVRRSAVVALAEGFER